MSTYLIKKGRHQDTRLFSSWPHIGRTTISRRVVFTESCRYELPSYNSLDTNKLFGLSFGLFAVHENSARFGWYYDKQDDTIVLVAYCYSNGKRNWNAQLSFPEVARVKIGTSYYCYLTVGDDYYRFAVTDGQDRQVMYVPHKGLPEFGLTHSVYFGGALPAPHDITIQMLRL